MVTYIDVTPTWEDLVTSFLAMIESGNADSRAFAIKELTRMAKTADLYVAAKKEEAA